MMNNDAIANQLDKTEERFTIKLPVRYREFSCKEIGHAACYEVQTAQGDSLYLYSYSDLIERNTTYAIREAFPDFLLIGQDGDLGYFLNTATGGDTLYRSDLGAPDSLDMEKIAEDIYQLLA